MNHVPERWANIHLESDKAVNWEHTYTIFIFLLSYHHCYILYLKFKINIKRCKKYKYQFLSIFI